MNSKSLFSGRKILSSVFIIKSFGTGSLTQRIGPIRKISNTEV